MRLHAVGDIAETWAHCMRTYAGTAPAQVNSCLKTVTTLAPWIDIGLVANERILGAVGAFAREPVKS